MTACLIVIVHMFLLMVCMGIPWSLEVSVLFAGKCQFAGNYLFI